MSALRHLMVMVLAAVAVLITVSPAATQLSKPPRDPALIQRKLQRSAELQREALQALTDPKNAERIVKNAYGQLMSAKEDMVVNASNVQFPDPLFAGNKARVDQALALLLGAWDTLKLRDQWSDPSSQVARVRNNLQQALRLTNTLLATSF